MRLQELLHQSEQKLREMNIAESHLDASLLLCFCLGLTRTELILRANEKVDESQVAVFWDLIKRRIDREPVAYITGEQEFWSLPFTVNRDVLIPRPETEFLLEQVFKKVGKKGPITHALDLCCGSGAIGVVLALELHCSVTALDCSPEALETARRNCMHHGVAERVSLIKSDLFSALEEQTRFPLIVSNPPYVPDADVAHDLQPEVALYEPHLALKGGEDGMDCIRRIAADILSHLEPEGMLFMEIGAQQGETVKKLFENRVQKKQFFPRIEIIRDYSGRDRVLFAEVNNYTD